MNHERYIKDVRVPKPWSESKHLEMIGYSNSDNAMPHTHILTNDDAIDSTFQCSSIKTPSWPPNSPDLNPLKISCIIEDEFGTIHINCERRTTQPVALIPGDAKACCEKN